MRTLSLCLAVMLLFCSCALAQTTPAPNETLSDYGYVQSNLGHATAQFTLDTYGHVTQKMRQESADRMQKFYDQLYKE